ncbi:hypothetical protein BDN72DRAFT_765962, partial [Pluteus cervinus]
DFFRYSILPAMSLDGILHFQAMEGAVTGDDFLDFITQLLERMQLWPLPNSVLVMDNASIHKVPGIRELVEARYHWLRANRDYVIGELEGALIDPCLLLRNAVYEVVTPWKIYGWYRHSEYIA